jgi:hypothetical protein
VNSGLCYGKQEWVDATAPEMPLASSSKLRAVVLGGSMAGLTAAQALSSEFDEVIILERDTLENCEVMFSRGCSWGSPVSGKS